MFGQMLNRSAACATSVNNEKEFIETVVAKALPAPFQDAKAIRLAMQLGRLLTDHPGSLSDPSSL